jgi:hypothetical protein
MGQAFQENAVVELDVLRLVVDHVAEGEDGDLETSGSEVPVFHVFMIENLHKRYLEILISSIGFVLLLT